MRGTGDGAVGKAGGDDGGMSDSELLDLVDTQIAALLSGGAVKSWEEGGHKVAHMSLLELYRFKQQLETRIAQAGGGMFLPVREIDV